MDSRLQIQRTAFSGNGVFATSHIPHNTLLLTASDPYASIIYRPYRKETCAWCFAYNLGRHFKIRCVDFETGFVFCRGECRQKWEADVGILGMQACEAVETFVRLNRKPRRENKEEKEKKGGKEERKPSVEQVAKTWKDAEVGAHRIRAFREGFSNKKRIPKEVSSPANPDTLSFLLSGILALHKPKVEGNLHRGVNILYEAPVPYVSHTSLTSHTTSYLQLLAVLPLPVLDLVTASNVRRIIGIAYDNAFGIRSADHSPRSLGLPPRSSPVSTALLTLKIDELESPGSEVLGYALYPSASLFNHSCLPNLRKVREGREWRFWSVQEIKDGDEVCITYLGGDERTLSTMERKERLRLGWEFECGCETCCDTSEKD